MAGAPEGNQNAAKGRRWQDALIKALARYTSQDGLIKAGEALDNIAKCVVEKALGGDRDAIAEIGNRLDGKPVQAVAIDPDSGPLQVTIVRFDPAAK